MKRILFLALLLGGLSAFSQTQTELKQHFEAYYKKMKSQGDIQGTINGLTHLDLLEPSQAKKDTLAYLYLSEGRNLQALNTIGVDKKADDSNIAVEVKALALKAVGETQLAVEHFQVMFERKPNALIAYELADLKTQLNDLAGAKSHIEYGLANAREDQMRGFFEMQNPYQVPVKAAFLYLKALITFNEDQTNNVDASIALLDQALQIEPNFNMAALSKDALVGKKTKE
jgi:tetratricopeptide (TPR) repeat protein